jgi:hypothetical protein
MAYYTQPPPTACEYSPGASSPSDSASKSQSLALINIAFIITVLTFAPFARETLPDMPTPLPRLTQKPLDLGTYVIEKLFLQLIIYISALVLARVTPRRSRFVRNVPVYTEPVSLAGHGFFRA